MKNKRTPEQATLDFDKTPHSNRRLFCGNILNRRLPETPAWSAAAPDEFPGKIRAATQAANTKQLIETLGFKLEKQPPGMPAIISAGANRAAFAIAQQNTTTCACRLVQAMSDNKLNWGIITDGAAWRLYSGSVFSPLDNYYETDLPFLLTDPGSPDFNYFRLFFTADGFKKSGIKPSFIDNALAATRKAQDDLVEKLRDAAELAALDLCRGFILHEKETTGATPDGPGLDMIYRHSILLLYRILYILLAEAWGALPSGNPEYRASNLTGFAAETTAPGSLAEQKSPAAYTAWPVLEKIFERARRGDKALDALPQCGELFDPERHKFLLRNKIGDPLLQLALARIIHTERDTDASFSDLHPARAAEIIGRLPQMRIQIAKQPMVAFIEKGRRACKPDGGAKPKNTTEKIKPGDAYLEHPAQNPVERARVPMTTIARSVETTLAPVADKAFSSGDPADAIRTLSIFDPVCGAAASLMAAAEYIARRACSAGNLSFQQYKRIAVESAIYGADPNPLMAETARIVLSLYTASDELPPPVIESRITSGNALLGVSVKEISELDIPSSKNIAARINAELARIAQETQKAETSPSTTYGEIRRKEGTLRRLAREQAALASAADLILETQLAQKTAAGKTDERLLSLAQDPAKFTSKHQPPVSSPAHDATPPLHIEFAFPALFATQNGKSAFTAALITAPSAMRLDKSRRNFAAKRLALKGRLVPADALSRALAPYIAAGGSLATLAPPSFSRAKLRSELAAFLAANYKHLHYLQ